MFTAIGPIVSESIFPNKNRHSKRQADGNARPTFSTLGVMKRRENMKIAIRRMDPIYLKFHNNKCGNNGYITF